MKHLTALVMTVGVGGTTLKKKEQQEVIAGLQEISVQKLQ